MSHGRWCGMCHRDQRSMGLKNKNNEKENKASAKSGKTKERAELTQQDAEPAVKRCPQCNMAILDAGETCPLCHCVLEEPDEEGRAKIHAMYGNASPYPDVRRKQRWARFALRLIFFIMFIAAVAMLVINRYANPGFKWSVIAVAGEIYAYSLLVYWVKHDSGFAMKIGLQLLMTIAMLYLIDRLTGDYGWALQWAIPGVILLGDLVVFFLMMLNRSRWHSYLVLLIVMGLCSVAIVGLYFAGLLKNGILAMICVAVTGLFLLATFIFGDRKITMELKRRFHI